MPRELNNPGRTRFSPGPAGSRSPNAPIASLQSSLARGSVNSPGKKPEASWAWDAKVNVLEPESSGVPQAIESRPSSPATTDQTSVLNSGKLALAACSFCCSVVAKRSMS